MTCCLKSGTACATGKLSSSSPAGMAGADGILEDHIYVNLNYITSVY